MAAGVRGKTMKRLSAAALTAAVGTGVFAWQTVPVSATPPNDCCGLAGFCAAVAYPRVQCLIDSMCNNGDWCCWDSCPS